MESKLFAEILQGVIEIYDFIAFIPKSVICFIAYTAWTIWHLLYKMVILQYEVRQINILFYNRDLKVNKKVQEE